MKAIAQFLGLPNVLPEVVVEYGKQEKKMRKIDKYRANSSSAILAHTLCKINDLRGYMFTIFSRF